MSEKRNAAARLLMQEMRKSLNPAKDVTELAIDATLRAVELERELEIVRKNMNPRDREEADRKVRKQKILEDISEAGDIWGARKLVASWNTLGGGE
jgi:hypothetical protein